MFGDYTRLNNYHISQKQMSWMDLSIVREHKCKCNVFA